MKITVVEKDGEIQISELLPGSYQVFRSVSDNGYRSTEKVQIRIQGQNSASWTVVNKTSYEITVTSHWNGSL